MTAELDDLTVAQRLRVRSFAAWLLIGSCSAGVVGAVALVWLLALGWVGLGVFLALAFTLLVACGVLVAIYVAIVEAIPIESTESEQP